MNYQLPEELREKFKQPLGELLPEPDWEGKFITVGDECSYLAAKAYVEPILAIYDHKIKRKDTCDEKQETIEKMPGKKITVDNPAGMIKDEAVLAVKLGLEHAPSKVYVNGEEDLLVLPCLIHAPENTVVYYGQPDEGVVKVIVKPETRKRAKEFLLSMQEVK